MIKIAILFIRLIISLAIGWFVATLTLIFLCQDTCSSFFKSDVARYVPYFAVLAISSVIVFIATSFFGKLFSTK